MARQTEPLSVSSLDSWHHVGDGANTAPGKWSANAESAENKKASNATYQPEALFGNEGP